VRWLVAPDSFKGALRAPAAASAIAGGLEAGDPEARVDVCPMADGGEGTVDAVLAARPGQRRRVRVTGPLGAPVEAEFALLDEGATAWIEMAAAAGLELVPEAERDPGRTTTYGVGELVRAALDAGARRIVVGVGGSATTDGGAGLGQALGARLEGVEVPATGSGLARLRGVDLGGIDPRLASAQLRVAADVTNPLLGPRGAAAVYGPQKGADAGRVAELEEGLARLAEALPQVDAGQPGAGAAGGLGFGLVAFGGARLVRGVELVMDAVGFAQRLARCDALVTGEGRLDGQSLQGKLVPALAAAARAQDVPAVALVGAVGEATERLLDAGLVAWLALADAPMDEAQAMRETPRLLHDAAASLARLARAFSRPSRGARGKG
jgi:glycerate kinase